MAFMHTCFEWKVLIFTVPAHGKDKQSQFLWCTHTIG